MRGLFFIFIPALPWPTALAAPWVQSEGEFYLRSSISSEEVEGLQAYRTDTYGEYGLAERWTVTAKVEAVAYERAEDFNSQGWRATARRSLFKYKNFIGAVEFGALQGAAIGGSNGCETLGADMRVGMAWSGLWRERDTFGFAEIAGREHDGCRRQRAEFGIGRRVSENIWSITQVWSERGSQNAASDKVQSEILWRADTWDFSFGYRQENGRQFDEEGLFLAIAKRY